MPFFRPEYHILKFIYELCELLLCFYYMTYKYVGCEAEGGGIHHY